MTVHANPRPNFVWHINGEEINEGQSDESNHLQTSTSTNQVSKNAAASRRKIVLKIKFKPRGISGRVTSSPPNVIYAEIRLFEVSNNISQIKIK